MRLCQVGVRAAAAVYAVSGVTLVCNDWWLKGAGILPGWLTGKLSDLAGLVVAIVTAALVLGHPRARASFTACISIASVFALVKLSPASAQLFVAALASVGLKWRLVPDPTDLVALGVVPLAWATARTLTQRMQQVGLGRLALRASAIPAAVACLASGVPDHFSASSYVYNDSGKTLFVEISSIPWLTCGQLDLLGTDWLERSDFQSLGLYQVGPHEVLPLAGDGYLSGDCECLYRVSFEGKSVVVRVPNNNVALEKSPDRDALRKARPQLVVVKPGGEPIPGSLLPVVEIPVTAAESSCAAEPGPMTFSARVTGLTNARIVAMEPVAGECFELQLANDEPSTTGAGGAAGAAGESSTAGGAAGAAGLGGAGPDADDLPTGIEVERVQVCVPPALIPFTVGDVVTLSLQTLDDGYGHSTHRLEIIERTGTRGFRLELGAPRVGLVATTQPDMSCGPSRDQERLPWVPLEATVGPGFAASGDYTLSPGERHDVALANGNHATVYLGRSRHFLNASWCGWSGAVRPIENWIEIAESWSP